jgi:hypothetical protein
MVTDYDCWRGAARRFEVSAVIAQLMANADIGRRLVVELARSLRAQRTGSPIDTVLDAALITAPDARDPAMIEKLDVILGPDARPSGVEAGDACRAYAEAVEREARKITGSALPPAVRRQRSPR